MTEKQIQEVQDEALKIYRDYAHLTFKEAIARAIAILTNKGEEDGTTENII